MTVNVQEYQPRFKHYVDIYALPESLQKLIREFTCSEECNEYEMIDYTDGDFYYSFDLSIDTSLAEKYVHFEDYLSGLNDDFTEDEPDINATKMSVIVFELKKLLPENITAENSFSVYCCH